MRRQTFEVEWSGATMTPEGLAELIRCPYFPHSDDNYVVVRETTQRPGVSGKGEEKMKKGTFEIEWPGSAALTPELISGAIRQCWNTGHSMDSLTVKGVTPQPNTQEDKYRVVMTPRSPMGPRMLNEIVAEGWHLAQIIARPKEGYCYYFERGPALPDPAAPKAGPGKSVDFRTIENVDQVVIGRLNEMRGRRFLRAELCIGVAYLCFEKEA